MNKKTTFEWISSMALKSKNNICFIIFLQIVLSITGIAYAFLFKLLVDAALEKDWSFFVNTIFMFVGILILQLGLRFAYSYLVEYTRSDFENFCKTKIFSAVMRKDFSTVTSVHSGEWLNRITSDTTILADGLVQLFPYAVGIFTKLLGGIVAIYILDYRIIFLLFPEAVADLILTIFFRISIKKFHKEVQKADGKLRIFLTERLSNQILIRSYVLQDQTVQDAREWMEDHKAARMKRIRFASYCNVGIGGLFNGTYILCAVICGYGILTGTMTFGNMTALLQLANQIRNPFADISGLLPRYYGMLASAERLMEVEEYPNEEIRVISEDEMKLFYEKDFQSIGLRDITFAYPEIDSEDNSEAARGEAIFQKFSLEINKGDYIAFTGISGKGKSTLFKILLCLYPLNEGEEYIRTNSGEIPLTSKWRSLFSYVPQRNALLFGTIREIITFGNKEKMQDQERIREALRIACADTFVNELEKGIDTVLGENGTGLSEGQLQRIAIARAVFSNHPILLLDESTSALDDETERKVLTNLKGLTDKTVLIITHRQASLKICNKHIAF